MRVDRKREHFDHALEVVHANMTLKPFQIEGIGFENERARPLTGSEKAVEPTTPTYIVQNLAWRQIILRDPLHRIFERSFPDPELPTRIQFQAKPFAGTTPNLQVFFSVGRKYEQTRRLHYGGQRGYLVELSQNGRIAQPQPNSFSHDPIPLCASAAQAYSISSRPKS